MQIKLLIIFFLANISVMWGDWQITSALIFGVWGPNKNQIKFVNI